MADRVGQQVGHYHLQALLGEGGYAQVYLGEHRYLKTQAAIKMLAQRLDPAAQQAFLEEAQTLARLIHPHIVRVLDFGLDNGTPFLVMDYAPYGSLRQRYPLGLPLPLPEILPLVQQAAQAIQYAHAAGRIHRDIKPDNLLLGRQQEVWLSDFGLAVLDERDHTSVPAIAGTLAYVAPEQLQGKPVPASDQYALGVLVYEWLSGDVPFAGDWLEVASQHLLAAPPPLRNKLPALPPAVEEVVLTALAKDPQKRFPSVKAFATALTRASEEAWPTYSLPTALSPLLPAETPEEPELSRSLLLGTPDIPADQPHPRHAEQDEDETAPPETEASRTEASTPTHTPTALAVSAAASPDPSSQEPSGNAPRVWGRGLVAFRTALPAPQRNKTTERLVMTLMLVSLLCLGYGFLGLGWFNPTQSVAHGHTGLAPLPSLPTASATITLAAPSTPTTSPIAPATASPSAGTTPSAPPAPTTTAWAPCQLSSSIRSNFNGTSIPAGDFVWFSSVLTVQGLQGLTSPITLLFDQQTITFSSLSLVVPRGQVTFTPGATTATTTFGVSWQTDTSTTGSGTTFLSGAVYPAVTGLPGGITPVTWSGAWFVPADVHLTVTWQWAAAVYTSFSGAYSDLGVKPVDGSQLSPYQNADHAGTPENFRQEVTGGARGGGGSNFTGGLTGTASVECP